MRSRKFIGGALVVAVLTAVSLLGTVTGSEELAAAARTVLLGTTGLLALAAVIALRRTGRQTDYIFRKGVAVRGEQSAGPTLPTAEPGPAVQQEDLVGMVRLMQAQYVGRLDRAQSTLEQAASQLAVLQAGAETVSGTQGAVLTVPEAREAYVPAVDAALGSGVSVVVTAPGEDARQWVQSHGWGERVTLAPTSADVREP